MKAQDYLKDPKEYRFDFHTHTLFSDGDFTPEEMVLRAIELGLDAIGISDHSFTEFDQRYCIKEGSLNDYVSAVNALKKAYAGIIDIFCAHEMDYYSEEPEADLDYRIGSVHYLAIEKNGETIYVGVDESAEEFKRIISEYFDGDVYAFAGEYFKTVSDVIRKTSADLIGHFDLFAKFNQGNRFFDPKDPRYINAWKAAVDKLIPFNKPFEINTSQVARGKSREPYPASDIREYIRSRGGRFVLSSDAHETGIITARFQDFKEEI